ncbi:MAG: hypothetical protein HOB73_11805 [Planctomycetaceae bacterium]|jgi:hypothetical protein|nr:hypothetical protein [Planctomycetaceae bacterium]
MPTLRSRAKLVLSSTTIATICFVVGCSLPVIPADDAYEVLGGIVEREHPSIGRANSAFELDKSRLTSDIQSTQTAPPIPSILRDPQPLERSKHSPIIP